MWFQDFKKWLKGGKLYSKTEDHTVFDSSRINNENQSIWSTTNVVISRCYFLPWHAHIWKMTCPYLEEAQNIAKFKVNRLVKWLLLRSDYYYSIDKDYNCKSGEKMRRTCCEIVFEEGVIADVESSRDAACGRLSTYHCALWSTSRDSECQ